MKRRKSTKVRAKSRGKSKARSAAWQGSIGLSRHGDPPITNPNVFKKVGM